ncbi:uncharacterized protein LOC129599430 [Paramacrobiotus metropolitanus]|uniref:uncharacterized protein LOC129599430 n=1 Tax=Paramacrobiotus metropolitanus TaxID=2943436 RepID=UPI002445F5D8|nr:uncharacterized protein LOC129599430 [Paramacrobiotus metropolitanus]
MSSLYFFEFIFSVLLITASSTIGQDLEEPPQCPVQKPDKCLNTADIKAALNDFTVRAYKQLATSKSTPADSNIVFLPLHVSTALLLACAASKGPTHDEIIAALNLGSGINCEDAYGIIQYLYRTAPHKTDPPTRFDDATFAINRLYVDKSVTLRPEFVHAVQTNFNQTPGVEDFKNNAAGAINNINNWAKEQSSGNIQNVANEQTINKDTTVTLVNSHYLQFLWSQQFDPKNTVAGDFSLLNGAKASVKMMVNKEKNYMYFNNLDGKAVPNVPAFEMIDLMDKWATGSVLVFVPKDAKDLANLEKALTPALVDQAFSNTKRTLMNLSVPKFTVESVTDVSKIASGLGINKLFSKDADLSPMTTSKGVTIKGIAHKAMIDVNEQGLKAAAVGIATAGKSAFNVKPPINVTVDRPFVFVIRIRETEFLSYVGRVTNPVQK